MSLIDDDIVILIVKHISHDDTNDDRNALDHWAHLSEYNRRFVEQHINETFIAGRLNLYRQFDIERGWRKVILKSVQFKKTKMEFMKGKGYAVAFMMIAVTVYLYSKMSEKKMTPVIQKDMAPVAADTNQNNVLTVEDGYIATPKGRQFQASLPDGSKVWLNAASSLRFPVSFNGAERKVEVTGEAYFEIAPDLKRPFYVSIRNAQIDVSGSGLNIRTYADEKVAKVTLATGTAKITTASSTAQMKGGQQARLANASGNINILVQDVDTANAVAWKKGDFIFDHIDLQTILRELSRWYDVEVVYERPPVPDEIFSGMISRTRSLPRVMQVLEQSGIKYRIDGRRLIIK